MELNRAETEEFSADVPPEYVGALKNQRLGQLLLVAVLILAVTYVTKAPGMIFGICLPLAYVVRLLFAGKQYYKYIFSRRGVRMVPKSRVAMSSAIAINYWLDFEKNRVLSVGNSTWKNYPALVFIHQSRGKEWLVPMERDDIEAAFNFCSRKVLPVD